MGGAREQSRRAGGGRLATNALRPFQVRRKGRVEGEKLWTSRQNGPRFFQRLRLGSGRERNMEVACKLLFPLHCNFYLFFQFIWPLISNVFPGHKQL